MSAAIQAAELGHEGPPSLCRFMGVELEAGADVLVPREETEILGRSAVGILRRITAAATMVDMCCGSGNLALAIATEVPSVRVWGCDLTRSSVSLARRNAERCGLSDRVAIRQGDLFSALDGEGLEGVVDLVVGNPPYISTARLDGDSSYLVQSEPREAFDGGPYGLSLHQRLVREAVPFLKPSGWLAFEFGEGQARQVAALLARTHCYSQVEFVSDDAGRPRAAIARKVG